MQILTSVVMIVVIALTAEQGFSSDRYSVAETLLKKSRALQMLALGERHWSSGEHAFIRELLLSPHFAEVFPVVVVEFGNAFYQEIADRYVSGEEVPDQQLEQVWRNTTVPMAWDSPVYAEFFRTLREVNKGLAKRSKVRIVLGDPPIDWSKVDSVESFKPYMDRDAFYADVISRNCGERRCLLICGTNHFYWKDPLSNLRPPPQHKNPLEYYLQQGGDRSKVQSVLPIFSEDKILAAEGTPALLNTHDSPLDKLRFGEVDHSRVSILKKVGGEMKPVEVQPGNTLAVSEVVDWVLYLGATDQKISPPASVYQDRTYIKELYRRTKIVGDAFGFDLTSDVKEVDPNAAKNKK